MPFVSKAQRAYLYANHPKVAAEFQRHTPKGAKLPKHVKGKKKYKMKVDNKIKSYGEMNPKTNEIKINVKSHKKKGKLDKAELASTIKHEIMHVKHPKRTEKEVTKLTAKTKIPPKEQSELLRKLQSRKAQMHGREGAIRKKLKVKPGEAVGPGELFNRAKQQSQKAESGKDGLPSNPRERTAIMGLV